MCLVTILFHLANQLDMMFSFLESVPYAIFVSFAGQCGYDVEQVNK